MMRINWALLAEVERRRFLALDERERYAYFLALLYGCEAGGEADGSGQVALALGAATGLIVRMSADELLRELFTERNPLGRSIQAASLVTRKDRIEREEVARKGSATHVAGIVARGVALSFERPRAVFRTLDELWTLCGLWDYDLRVRGLDRRALERVAAGRRELDEPGGLLPAYFEEAAG